MKYNLSDSTILLKDGEMSITNGSSISVSALASGNYYMEITLKDGFKKIEKLIVE
jgi:hypothetical protein